MRTNYHQRAAATAGDLRAALAARGVSQAELARRLERAPSTVERWARGHLPIDRVTWLAVLAVLDLPRGWTPPRAVPAVDDKERGR